MSKLLFSYLKFWATGYLKRTNPEIVGVTGSVGKTSTKEAIFEVLKTKFGDDVRKAEGNLNNESGLPVAILGFKSAPSYEAKNSFGWIPIIIQAPFRSFFLKKCKILILEYAADKPGDIKYLTSIAKPKVAVLTSIGTAHLEYFENQNHLIEEKTNLLRAMPADGLAIINLDDENARKVSYGGRWRKYTYAIVYDADFMASSITTKIDNFKVKTKFNVKWLDHNIEVRQSTLGKRANILSSLAAVAVADFYKLDDRQISKGLENIQSEKHRLNVLSGIHKSIIIDDTYNANPDSVKAALEILQELSVSKTAKKIAVLGDMREIGNESAKFHQEMGEMAKNVADQVISYGPQARNCNAQKHFNNLEKTTDYLLKEIGIGDIILIKGSRAMKMEKIVEALKE